MRIVRLALVLACGMFVACVPAAMAQTGYKLWSIQLDGGMFRPIEATGASPNFGMRYSKHYNGHVMGGLRTGFAVKTNKVEAPAGNLQSGDVEIARVDAHLVPLMGFMQVDLTEQFFVVPFVGIAAGYEWLSLKSTNHQTGADSTATFGNIAWEGYAGVGFRLASRVRLNGEMFYNGGSLERRAPDANGGVWREAVDVNGVGLRVGLDMIFD